jgi:ABC-type phosphate transport system substrate-binding protein
MIRFRNIVSSLTLAAITATVAACTPPLPPELQAQLADNSINCGSSPISVSGSMDITPILEQWSMDYLDICPNAGATVAMQGDGTAADFVISNSIAAPVNCEPSLTIPIFVGGTSIVTSLQGLDGMILDPATLSGIINGEITSWSDPQIVAINPQFEPIELPVQLATTITKSDAESIDAWLTRLAPDVWAGFPDSFTFTETFDVNTLPPQVYEDGGIVFAPFTFASLNGLQTALLKVATDVDAVPSYAENIASAASQLGFSSVQSPFEVTIDNSKEPLPVPGFDVALTPWQAVVVQYGHVCKGALELDSQAFVRYGLRSSSQGVLSNYGYLELPIEVRGAALELVSRGLPSPSPLEPETAATP